MYKLIFLFLLILNCVSFSQNLDDPETEDSDFQSPGQNDIEEDEECKLSPEGNVGINRPRRSKLMPSKRISKGEHQKVFGNRWHSTEIN